MGDLFLFDINQKENKVSDFTLNQLNLTERNAGKSPKIYTLNHFEWSNEATMQQRHEATKQQSNKATTF